MRRIQSFDPSALPTQFGGEIVGFDARNYLEKKDRKRLNVMVRTIQFAVAAAQLALDDSGVDKQQLDPTRFGVEFGSSVIPSELRELAGAARVGRGSGGRRAGVAATAGGAVAAGRRGAAAAHSTG